MKKILFSNAMGPYDLGMGENTKDMFGSRMTRGQDIFTLKGHAHALPLYLLA